MDETINRKRHRFFRFWPQMEYPELKDYWGCFVNRSKDDSSGSLNELGTV